MTIRLTASGSSRISKSSGSNRRRAEIPLLPEDRAYIKSLEDNKQLRTALNQQKQVQLQDIGPAKLEWHSVVFEADGGTDTLVAAMRYILDKQWALEIPHKSVKIRTSIQHVRDSVPPVVGVSHLTAIFPNNTTFLERKVARLCEQGILRKLTVSLTSVGDLVIESKDYFKILDEIAIAAKGNSDAEKAIERFKTVLIENPSAISLSAESLNDCNTTFLIQAGLLTFGRDKTFGISVPNLGMWVRLLVDSRKWLLNTLGKLKWKEMLASQLESSFTSNKAFWKDFKGLAMEWVQFDGYGGGWIEPFSTPVGIGWKLTGKT